MSDQQRRERALAFIEEGLDGQACKALLSKGCCEDTAGTIDALSAKHPRGRAVFVPDAAMGALPPSFGPEEVLETL